MDITKAQRKSHHNKSSKDKKPKVIKKLYQTKQRQNSKDKITKITKKLSKNKQRQNSDMQQLNTANHVEKERIKECKRHLRKMTLPAATLGKPDKAATEAKENTKVSTEAKVYSKDCVQRPMYTLVIITRTPKLNT